MRLRRLPVNLSDSTLSDINKWGEIREIDFEWWRFLEFKEI